MSPRRTIVLLIVLLAGAIVIGAGLSFTAYRRAAMERDRAHQAKMMAVESRMRAEHERRKAEQIERFLRDTMLAADPAAAGKPITVKEALDAASKKLDNGTFKDQPEVQAHLHAAIGQAYRNAGGLDSAEKHLRAALDLRIKAMGPDHTSVQADRDALDALLKSKPK
jgi:hypothetical protein